MRFFQGPNLDAQRRPLVPRNMISGSLPGATQIRIGGDQNVLIDGLNKRITVGTSGGESVGMGIVPGTTDEFGFFTLDANGNLTQKTVGGILYFYDESGNLIQKIAVGTRDIYRTDGTNVMRDGILPDDTAGVIVVEDGSEVDDVFA